MRKQVITYFNLDNKDEKLMYEYLEDRDKNFVIKRLLLNEINQVGYIGNPQIPPTSQDEEISQEETAGIFNQ